MKVKLYLIKFFLLTTCSIAAHEVEDVKTKRPNIVVVLADDMRTNYTGFEGHPIIQTPNLNKLASLGTTFSKGFATSAACTPSRTSLLTGLYERRHGVNFNSESSMTLNAFRQTYPMLLQDTGYFVGYVGKNHTPIGKNEYGVLGYKSGVMEQNFNYWYGGHKHLGFYPKDYRQHAIFKNAQADSQVEIIEEGVENFLSPNQAFQAGQTFLTSRDKNKPFALLINFNLPHDFGTRSMALRKSDLSLYKETYRDQAAKLSPPVTYIAQKDIQESKLPRNVYNGDYISIYDYVKTEEGLRERQVRTLQAISGIDKLIGKLMSTLKEQGVADNTIIVFTSDHGLMHGEFGMGGKVFLYDSSVRVPLVIYDPRMKNKAHQSDELVALVDIAPTLLDLTNTPVHVEMQGKSLKSLMKGEKIGWRQEIFLENMMTIQNYPRMEGVRTHKWKYVRYFDKKKDQSYAAMSVASINGEQPIYEELFDLENDPHEISNLIAEPVYTDVVKELRHKNAVLVKEYRGNKPFNTHVNYVKQ